MFLQKHHIEKEKKKVRREGFTLQAIVCNIVAQMLTCVTALYNPSYIMWVIYCITIMDETKQFITVHSQLASGAPMTPALDGFL